MTTTPTRPATSVDPAILELERLRAGDTLVAGGKGANLGELTSVGMPVPAGFVVTASSWVRARDAAGIGPELEAAFADLDHTDDDALARACALAERLVSQLAIPDDLRDTIVRARRTLLGDTPDAPVIVRSSATLEDSATASFAGMNETFANVSGEDATIDAVRQCWASLFAPRTVFYRAERGMPLAEAQLAVVVQRYVPADYSGIMFTSDPSAGDDLLVTIEATIGSGSAIVSGHVTPDRFIVNPDAGAILERHVQAKALRAVDDAGGGTHEEPVAGDAARDSVAEHDVLQVADLGARIARHYGTAQDIEWLVDERGAIWIVQSRPITVSPMASSAGPSTAVASPLLRGVPASAGIASGPVRIMTEPTDAGFQDGDILVARMTSPDWAPLMRRAAAIVTDTGGMTCHAAIVAREMAVPCVVGTGTATSTLHDGAIVTVDGAAGTITPGRAPTPSAAAAQVPTATAPAMPPVTATSVMVNLSDVSQVDRVAALPCDGVGLLRAETMLVDALGGEHPLSLVARGHTDDAIERLGATIERFARAFHPRPVTYRTIDLRSNEFRRLRGGDVHEAVESNPMIGFRGAGRYADQPELLELEARALATVWDAGGTNLRVMLPFVRTPGDVIGCLATFRRTGLLDDPRFQLWVMAEVPSVLHYLARYRDLGIAGISIGTNDLTQLLLGADRDSERLARYDATDEAVTAYIEELLESAHALGLATSICGQAPAVHPEYVDLLVGCGIGSISVTPDALSTVRRSVDRAERRLLLDAARR